MEQTERIALYKFDLPGSWSRWGSRGSMSRSMMMPSSATTSESSSARKSTRGSSNASDLITGSGIRLIRASQVRGRNLPLFSGGQKVVVPASHVPEELINQVQVMFLYLYITSSKSIGCQKPSRKVIANCTKCSKIFF